MSTAEQRALDLYPPKYTRDTWIRQQPDVNAPLRQAYILGRNEGYKYDYVETSAGLQETAEDWVFKNVHDCDVVGEHRCEEAFVAGWKEREVRAISGEISSKLSHEELLKLGDAIRKAAFQNNVSLSGNDPFDFECFIRDMFNATADIMKARIKGKG